jgi:hypothetical protein
MRDLTFVSKPGAQCGSPARWDLCGGRAEPQSEGPSLPRPESRRPGCPRSVKGGRQHRWQRYARAVGGPRAAGEPGHVRNLHAREPGLRHEALLCSDGGERPPSLGRRSGRVKLEAAGTGGCRGRWEQPRQSRVGPVLPDGPGPVSETGRSTRETGVVTPLDLAPALIRWMWAGLRCVSALHDGWRTPDRVFPAWVGRPR